MILIIYLLLAFAIFVWSAMFFMMNLSGKHHKAITVNASSGKNFERVLGLLCIWPVYIRDRSIASLLEPFRIKVIVQNLSRNGKSRGIWYFWALEIPA